MIRFINLFILSITFLFSSSSIAQNNITLKISEGIKINIYESNFNPANHKIEYCKIGDQKAVCLIDNKQIFGAAWEIPKTKIDSLIVEINNKHVKLDVSSMYNPWFGEANPENFLYEKCEGGGIINGLFSDGEGMYLAQWRIIKNNSIRTIISNSEDIIFSIFE